MRRFLVLLALTVVTSDLLAHPGAAIAVTADGRVHVVDTGGGVFSIERNGRAVRREGPAFHWFALDPQGRFRNTAWPSLPGAEFRSAGVNPTLILSSDYPVVIGSDGIFYYPQGSQRQGVRIVGITPAGAQSMRATLPPMQSGGKSAWWLNGLAAGPDRSLYYTEDRAVRRIDARGKVSAVAATVVIPNCTAIPGIGPELRPYLRGLAVAPDGTVYVAASGCGAVLRIEPGGKTTTILRTEAPWSPTAVAIANGELYVLEYLHTASDNRREWLPRVRRISRTGAVVTLWSSDRR
ncbi:MAG TPA: hypothetical protein VJ276_21265 [Thermoanaerobaculia bacterium]|nr:hypothetical protein [Thermoanaerobaculia bacterium]